MAAGTPLALGNWTSPISATTGDAAEGAGEVTRLSPTASALLGTAALMVALATQGDLNRRIFVVDAPYFFAWAVGLFIVAFPGVAIGARGNKWLRIAVQALLVAAAVLVTWKVYQDLRLGRDFVVSIALAFLPLMLVGAAFAGSRASSRPDDEPDSFLDRLWQRLPATPGQRWLDSFCVMSGLTLAAVAAVYWLKGNRTNDALVLNILSLVLLLLAARRLDRGVTIPAEAVAFDAPPLRVELLLLLAVVAVSAFLRFWKLEALPYGVWYDEAQAGQEALRFMQGTMAFTPMGTYTSNNPSPFFYLVAVAFRAVGPSLLALRSVQALIGLATVPLLYVFLRYILGWRAALVGALMLGVSAWHVDFSRFGMCCNIEAPPFEILTLYFLVRGLRTGKLLDFAWGGLAIGLGQFTYAAFRLFPAIIGIYVVYAFLLNKERVRKSLLGLVIYGLIALIAFAPIGAWAWEHRVEFMARTAQTSVFAGKNTTQEKMAALTNSLRRHVQMLNFQGDGNGRHGLPGAPAVDFISGALFVIGLGYCLYRWRSPAYPLLALWFVVMMQSGILSLDWEAPQQARTVVAIPAIYAIAAIPFAKVWGAWDRLARVATSPRARRLALAAVPAVVVAVLALLVYVNYDRYFNLQMKDKEVFYSFSTLETVVARRVAELGPTANRYYIQAQGTPVFSLLVGGDDANRPVDNVFFRNYAHMPLREPITKTAVFLLEPWRVTLDPAAVLHYYPNATFVDHKDPFGQTMVYEFQITPDDVNNLLGLTGRYYSGNKVEGAPAIERVDKQIAFDWRSETPVQAPFSVEWTGSIVPPDAGAYAFEFTGDGDFRMALDGQWLDIGVGTGKSQVRVELAKGLHPVTIQFKGQAINLRWTLPNGQQQSIPANALIAALPPDHGLLGKYYRGETWQGRPEFVQVDPYLAFRWHPDPIDSLPWSAAWTGKIEIPIDGKYLFQLISNDRGWLAIDNKALIDSGRGMRELETQLTAGKHDIVVKYANNKGYSEFRMMWRRADGTFEVVPNSVLYVQ